MNESESVQPSIIDIAAIHGIFSTIPMNTDVKLVSRKILKQLSEYDFA